MFLEFIGCRATIRNGSQDHEDHNNPLNAGTIGDEFPWEDRVYQGASAGNGKRIYRLPPRSRMPLRPNHRRRGEVAQGSDKIRGSEVPQTSERDRPCRLEEVAYRRPTTDFVLYNRG